MTRRSSMTVLAMATGIVGLTCCHPPTPTVAKVEIVAGANRTASDPRGKEGPATVDRAEQAIEARTLDGLAASY